MKWFFLLLLSSQLRADLASDLKALSSRVTNLEAILEWRVYTCSIKCQISSAPNGTATWNKIEASSGQSLEKAFKATVAACDSFFALVRKNGGYRNYNHYYDEDDKASVVRNCTSKQK